MTLNFIQSLASAHRASKSAKDGVYREFGLFIGRVVDVEDPQGLRRVKVSTESKDLKVSSNWAIRASQDPWTDQQLPKIDQLVLVAAIAGDPHDLVIVAMLDSTLLSEGAISLFENPDNLEKHGERVGINPSVDGDFKSANYPAHRRSQETKLDADFYPNWWTQTEAVTRVDGKRHAVSEGLHHHETVSFEEAIKLPTMPNPKAYHYKGEHYEPNGSNEAKQHFSPGLPPQHHWLLWSGLLYIEKAVDYRMSADMRPKYEHKHAAKDEVMMLLQL